MTEGMFWITSKEWTWQPVFSAMPGTGGKEQEHRDHSNSVAQNSSSEKALSFSLLHKNNPLYNIKHIRIV